MFIALGALFLLGVSLAQEPYEISNFGPRMAQWAEQKTAELMDEVNKAGSNLQQLAAKADSPRVKKLVMLFQEAQKRFSSCEHLSGHELMEGSYCVNITEDIANLTEVGFQGYELMDAIGSEVANLIGELNDCQGLSIFKQISCYKQAFKDIQETIKEYSIRCKQFLHNATAVFADIETDVSHCFSYSQSVSSVHFERKVQLCKQQLLSVNV